MRRLILDCPRDRLLMMLVALEGHAGSCVADLTSQLAQDADSDGGGGIHAPAAMLTCARSAVHVIVTAAASGVMDSSGRHCTLRSLCIHPGHLLWRCPIRLNFLAH